MGLFTRKPKISVQRWCEGLFNKYIFAAPIGGADPWELFCITLREQVSQADATFSRVNPKLLYDELLALRLEVIGITWYMRLKIGLSLMQSHCMKQCLADHDQERYWEMMIPYNKAVARAVVGGCDSSTAAGRAHITFTNSMRAQLFDDWVEKQVDPKHAARVANRFGSNVPWKAHKTHVYLSFALTDQLQCEVNDEARKRLMWTVQGFFDGTSQELKKVKIVP